MFTKNLLTAFFLLAIIVIIIPLSVFSVAKPKNYPVKLIVKLDNSTVLHTNKDIKLLTKKLNKFAGDMQKTAKFYNITDQRIYLEQELQKSFAKLLQSEGYYDAKIEIESLESANTIIFHITELVRYKIKDIQVKYAKDSNQNIKIPSLSMLKITEDQPAIATDILAAQDEIALFIENENCLLTLAVSHEAIIDRSLNYVSIIFIIDAGAEAIVKSVDFKGLRSINPDYARKLVPIKNGQCFKRSLIVKAQTSLQKTGLFAVTNPEVPRQVNKKNEVPVIFDIKERKHRSLKAGINYSNELGFGGVLGWDHRNLFGEGEALKSEAFANQKDQTIDIEFSKPFYKHDDQTLKIGLYGENISSKAFRNKEGSFSLGLERKLTDLWTASASWKYSYSAVKQSDRNRFFSFLSIPLFVKRDSRDNLLNPRSGNELTLKVEPFKTLKSEERSFDKSELSASGYIPLAEKTKLRPILALKASVGGISGTKLANIPANERFYVGGAGSLRGYAYQLAGDLGSKNRPLGGRSFLTTTIELRVQIRDELGLVTFFDSGNVFDKTIPNKREKLFHGFGFGMRYFTSFGPIRADIAFPAKRRHGIDKGYQIYFGIGQSF